jgi:hypothetical protein
MAACRFTPLDDFAGLGRALRVSDGRQEIVAALDVGPRVMRYALGSGGANMFEESIPAAEELGDGRTWRSWGGHRVWHSPEAFPRSYVPDGSPLESWEKLDDGLLLRQAEEPWTHIRKSLEVRLLPDRVRTVNTLANAGAWPVELSVWSMTVASRGGFEVIPVVQRNSGLLPNRSVVLWPDSPMNDRRVGWGERYITIDNDTSVATAFKLGVPNEYGWAAYFNHGMCLLVTHTHQRGASYPDFGCSWETFVADWGVELETLSPLVTLKPGASVSHVEEWRLFEGMDRPGRDEDALARLLAPVQQAAGITLPVVVHEHWKDAKDD